jgi:hypothetical protein
MKRSEKWKVDADLWICGGGNLGKDLGMAHGSASALLEF